MRFAIALTVAATIVATAAKAQDAISDHIGMFGIGYFHRDAPIGARLWMSPTFGVEAGIGFGIDADVPISRESGTGTVNLDRWAVEGALLFPLRSEPHLIFYARPGVGFFRSEEIIGGSGEQRTRSLSRIEVSGLLALELFFSKLGFDNLSLGAGHGVAITHTDPSGSGGSSTSFGTRLAELDLVQSSSVGFHYYF